ncbi:MAG: hypothetical protein JWM35_2772 [Verrucomicrobia bacterium]|nr:hypothetical protein [Verrucomicrobiota bacterium]
MNAEAVTALSDFALALLAAALATALFFRRTQPAAVGLLLCAFLAATGMAAALGGLWHGWRENLGPGTEFWVWKLTLLSIGMANACLLVALATRLARHGLVVRRVVLVKVAAYCVAIALTDSFLPAVCDQLATEFGALTLIFWDRRDGRHLPAAPLTTAVLLGLLSGIIQVSGVGVGSTLNHNVLYHLVGMASLVAFFFAGIALGRTYSGDNPTTAPTTPPNAT